MIPVRVWGLLANGVLYVAVLPAGKWCLLGPRARRGDRATTFGRMIPSRFRPPP